MFSCLEVRDMKLAAENRIALLLLSFSPFGNEAIRNRNVLLLLSPSPFGNEGVRKQKRAPASLIHIRWKGSQQIPKALQGFLVDPGPK
jgi:hypothetical protein